MIDGHDRASLAAVVLLRQGLPAWMMLVGAEEGARVAPCETSASSALPSRPPMMVRSELLAAFTDLLIGALGMQEV